MAKEMVLVDPAIWTALQANNRSNNDVQAMPTSDSIPTRVVQQTDKDINNILTSSLDPNEQVLFYNQALHKREQFADQTPSYLQNKLLSNINPKLTTHTTPPVTLPPTIESEKMEEGGLDDRIEQEIIDNVPKSFQGKAARLIKKMKQEGVLGWNARGNLTFKGDTIPSTNVVDLVGDVIRKRKRTQGPIGWDLFARGMHETNVPQELIGNPGRYSNPPMFTAASTTPFHRALEKAAASGEIGSVSNVNNKSTLGRTSKEGRYKQRQQELKEKLGSSPFSEDESMGIETLLDPNDLSKHSDTVNNWLQLRS